MLLASSSHGRSSPARGSGSRRGALGLPVLPLAHLAGAASLTSPGPVTVDPAAPAVIVLTSGTTGRPKAVVLSTAALVASAEAWLAALPPATGWLLAVGLGHVAGLGVVWRAALSGVPLVILARPDAAAIAATLARGAGDSATSRSCPTSSCASSRSPPGRRHRRRSALSCSVAVRSRRRSSRRALDAGWPVVPTYGLSEAGSGVTALPTDEAGRHPGSAGRALPGVELRIADADDAGVGEIQVRSPATV